MPKCVPCSAKELLNGEALAAWKRSEKIEKEVRRMFGKGEIDNEQALAVLEPLMKADRMYVDFSLYAQEKSSRALAAVKDLNE